MENKFDSQYRISCVQNLRTASMNAPETYWIWQVFTKSQVELENGWPVVKPSFSLIIITLGFFLVKYLFHVVEVVSTWLNAQVG